MAAAARAASTPGTRDQAARAYGRHNFNFHLYEGALVTFLTATGEEVGEGEGGSCAVIFPSRGARPRAVRRRPGARRQALGADQLARRDRARPRRRAAGGRRRGPEHDARRPGRAHPALTRSLRSTVVGHFLGWRRRLTSQPGGSQAMTSPRPPSSSSRLSSRSSSPARRSASPERPTRSRSTARSSSARPSPPSTARSKSSNVACTQDRLVKLFKKKRSGGAGCSARPTPTSRASGR